MDDEAVLAAYVVATTDQIHAATRDRDGHALVAILDRIRRQGHPALADIITDALLTAALHPPADDGDGW